MINSNLGDLLSIVIVNYCSETEIKNCIKSFKEIYKSSSEPEIFIVDNSAGVKNFDTKGLNYGRFSLIVPECNAGFSAANNKVFGKTSTKYILFLNPDVLFKEDCISQVISEMESTKAAGFCAPILLNKDGSFQFSFGSRTGLFFEFLEAFGLINFCRRIWYIFHKHRLKQKDKMQVGWVSGAFMIAERNLFETLNGFDEDFFLNYEDIDICRRAEEKGFRNYLFTGSECIHFGLSTQGRDYEKLIYDRYFSKLIYINKSYKKLNSSLVMLLQSAGLVFKISVLFFLRMFSLEYRDRYAGSMKALSYYLGKLTKQGP